MDRKKFITGLMALGAMPAATGSLLSILPALVEPSRRISEVKVRFPNRRGFSPDETRRIGTAATINGPRNDMMTRILTLLAIGVSSLFSLVLSARGLWSLRWGKPR